VTVVLLWGIALAGVLLGAGGAAVALASWRRDRAVADRLAGIEEASRQAREREARRVRMSIALEPEVEVRWYLIIRNDGAGPARECTMSLDGTALEESPIVDLARLGPGRLGTVGAHGTLRVPLRATSHPDALQLELRWLDAAGEPGLYQAELSR
jgi:hypothetical protein